MDVSSQELEINKSELVVTNQTDFSLQHHTNPSQYPRFTRQRSVWNMSDKYSDMLTVDYLLHNSQSYQREQGKHKDTLEPDKHKRQTSDNKQTTRWSSSTPDSLFRNQKSAQQKYYKPELDTTSDNQMMDGYRGSEMQRDAPFDQWSFDQFPDSHEVTTLQSIEHKRRQQEKMKMIMRQRIKLLKHKPLQRIRKISKFFT